MAEALLRLMPRWSLRSGRGEGAFGCCWRASTKSSPSTAPPNDRGQPRAGAAPRVKTSSTAGRHGRASIEDRAVDLVLLAIAPSRAAPSAIWRPGEFCPRRAHRRPRLLKHRFEEAREIYADEWLGFSEAELERCWRKAGFVNPQTWSSTRSRRAAVSDLAGGGKQIQLVL